MSEWTKTWRDEPEKWALIPGTGELIELKTKLACICFGDPDAYVRGDWFPVPDGSSMKFEHGVRMVQHPVHGRILVVL